MVSGFCEWQSIRAYTKVMHPTSASPSSSFLCAPYSYTWDQENLDDDGFSHTLSTTPWVLNWKIPVVLLQNTTKIWGVGSAKKPSNRIWTKKSPDFFRAFTLRIFITKEKRQSGKKGFHFVSSTNTLWLYVFNLPQVQVTIKSCYPREILIYALCPIFKV